MTPQGSKPTCAECGAVHRTIISAMSQWHEKIKRYLRDLKLKVIFEPCLDPNLNEPPIKDILETNEEI